MEFREFNSLLRDRVAEMTAGEEHLFTVTLGKGELWSTYLESFPDGTNERFRERREFDCHGCHNFLRDLGSVVAIKENRVETIWDFETGDAKYQPVVNALAQLIRSKVVRNVFLPVRRSFGTESNVEMWPTGELVRWYHLYAVVADSVKLFKEDELGAIRGQFRANRDVLERSFEEISGEAVDTVCDLISQGSLYKGEEWSGALESFRSLYGVYHAIESLEERANYCWVASLAAGPAIARIKNHSIGVLLTDISEGMELNAAVKRYEKIVAPTNYKRPKAIFSKRMVAAAKETVGRLGLTESLGRRHATIGDITVRNILFANRDAAKQMGEDAFDDLANGVAESPKRLGKVEEIGAKDFVERALPTASEIEVLLENGHEGNMVSLVAPENKGSPTMFKWNNGFSWAYSGNIADSMKQRVKSHGGNVEGELRFSIQWNDKGDCPDDLDAHCVEPDGYLISYPVKGRIQPSSGMLDVDILHPRPSEVAVENIIWTDKRRMKKGKYLLLVHNYQHRGGRSGFTAEVEFDGKIYSFSHPGPLGQGQKVQVARVTFDGESFRIEELLKGEEQSRVVWGLNTNTFYPVSAMMYSPNYWDEQDGIGHRHYLFLLKGCMNPESPNGFFNEFLKEELLQHKRVFEALGSKMRVEPTLRADGQLSGLGFSSTKRASVTCRVKGSFTRVVKVTF